MSAIGKRRETSAVERLRVVSQAGDRHLKHERGRGGSGFVRDAHLRLRAAAVERIGKFRGADVFETQAAPGNGRIERKVSLPETTDPEQVEADLAEGVLHVKLAKKPEAQPKRIVINVAE